MLLDLLSASNEVKFNIKVAQLFGLKAAVYLSELLVINEKALRKNKVYMVEDKAYFTICRSYITNRTTLVEKEQKEIDIGLIEVGVIEKHPTEADTIYLNIEGLAGLLGTKLNDSIIKNVNKLAQKGTKKTKAEGKIEGMRLNAQKAVKTTNPELRTAYYDWIDSVLNRYNTISKAMVVQNEKLVDDFSQHVLDVALAIVNKTAIGGYNTMQYAIDDYKNLHPSYFAEVKANTNMPSHFGNEVL